MKRLLLVPILLSATCFSACGENPKTASARIVRKELTRLSGGTAQSCGFIVLGASAESAWKCAAIADKSGRPFWLAIEEHGLDSIIWQAVGRDADGQRYLLSFDSSPYGRAGFHPRFTRDACNGSFWYEPKDVAHWCSEAAP
jgi:hypothetical protein